MHVIEERAGSWLLQEVSLESVWRPPNMSLAGILMHVLARLWCFCLSLSYAFEISRFPDCTLQALQVFGNMTPLQKWLYTREYN